MVHGPKPLPLDDRRVALADEIAEKLAESLPVPSVGRPTLTVALFQDDRTGNLTDAVRLAIDRVDRYAVQPTTFVENVLARWGLQQESVSPEKAPSVATEDLQTEYLLAGRVERLSARNDMDEAALTAVFVPVGSPECAIPLSVEIVHDHAAEANQLAAETKSWLTRFVSWLALTVLLPVVAAPASVHGLKLQSNAVNLALLLGMTFVSGLAAFATLDFRLDTTVSAALLIAAVAAALFYNWLILAKLEQLTA